MFPIHEQVGILANPSGRAAPDPGPCHSRRDPGANSMVTKHALFGRRGFSASCTLQGMQAAYVIGFRRGVCLWIPVMGNILACLAIPHGRRTAGHDRPPSAHDRRDAWVRTAGIMSSSCHQDCLILCANIPRIPGQDAHRLPLGNRDPVQDRGQRLPRLPPITACRRMLPHITALTWSMSRPGAR